MPATTFAVWVHHWDQVLLKHDYLIYYYHLVSPVVKKIRKILLSLFHSIIVTFFISKMCVYFRVTVWSGLFLFTVIVEGAGTRAFPSMHWTEQVASGSISWKWDNLDFPILLSLGGKTRATTRGDDANSFPISFSALCSWEILSVQVWLLQQTVVLSSPPC